MNHRVWHWRHMSQGFGGEKRQLVLRRIRKVCKEGKLFVS